MSEQTTPREQTTPPVIIITTDRDVADRAMRANPGVTFRWFRSMADAARWVR